MLFGKFLFEFFTSIYRFQKDVYKSQATKNAEAELRSQKASKKRKISSTDSVAKKIKTLQISEKNAAAENNSFKVPNLPFSTPKKQQSETSGQTSSDENNNHQFQSQENSNSFPNRRTSSRLSNRNSIPGLFNPIPNAPQSTPLNPTRPKVDSFCSPQPHWHHLENTVLRVDGAVANISTEDLDSSIQRAKILDTASNNDEIRQAVKNRFGLDTIDEQSETESPETAKEVAFETTVGERPVSARLRVIDENIDAVEITTTTE